MAGTASLIFNQSNVLHNQYNDSNYLSQKSKRRFSTHVKKYGIYIYIYFRKEKPLVVDKFCRCFFLQIINAESSAEDKQFAQVISFCAKIRCSLPKCPIKMVKTSSKNKKQKQKQWNCLRSTRKMKNRVWFFVNLMLKTHTTV